MKWVKSEGARAQRRSNVPTSGLVGDRTFTYRANGPTQLERVQGGIQTIRQSFRDHEKFAHTAGASS